MSLNLTEGLKTTFEFCGEIDGKMHTYEARYPSNKILRPIQMGYARLQAIDKEVANLSEDDKDGKKKLEDEFLKVSKEITDTFASLFTPVGDSMPIEDFLDELPAPAKKNFDAMIQKELL